jgi:hypothetical protein
MRQRPLSGDEAEDATAALEEMERRVPHPTAKTFWFKHFTPPTTTTSISSKSSSGSSSSSSSSSSPSPAAAIVLLPPTRVSWAVFARAFEEEFGPHPEEALERFKKVGGGVGMEKWSEVACGWYVCTGWRQDGARAVALVSPCTHIYIYTTHAYIHTYNHDSRRWRSPLVRHHHHHHHHHHH